MKLVSGSCVVHRPATSDLRMTAHTTLMGVEAANNIKYKCTWSSPSNSVPGFSHTFPKLGNGTRPTFLQQTNRSPTLMSNTPPDHQISPLPSRRAVDWDCLSCRIVGTGALGATGLYALNQARAHQPGSPVGKRIMAGIGVFFLLGSVARWRA